MFRAFTQPTLAPRSFGWGSGAGCGAAGSRSLPQPLVPNTHRCHPCPCSDAWVEILILTGTCEIKPHWLQDQTHHGHTVGSPSMFAEEEEEVERKGKSCLSAGHSPCLSSPPEGEPLARSTPDRWAGGGGPALHSCVHMAHMFWLVSTDSPDGRKGCGFFFFPPSSWWRKSQTQLFHTRRG